MDLAAGREVDKPVIFRINKNEFVILSGHEVIEYAFRDDLTDAKGKRTIQVYELSFKK